MLSYALLPLAAVAQPAPAPKPPLPPPHPLITEILYAVPTGAAGDANNDGTRHANGDEFIELVNPHAEPIQLRGYTITDRNPGSIGGPTGGGGGGFRFTFPDLLLAPGEVVVLFNGYESKWTGPVGDSDRAAAPHDRFAGARVFTMRVDSARVGLSNTHDYVLLTAPDGRPVHRIVWGDPVRGDPVRGDPVWGDSVWGDSDDAAAPAEKPPVEALLVEHAPSVIGQSVERTIDNKLVPHPHQDGRTYSPGKTPLARKR